MAACSYLAVLLLIFSAYWAKAQISTPCTSSVISSFTPCFNYLTGSSGTGASPPEECCKTLKSQMTDNMDCVCLIVTGNVPVSVPFINASLAISLPRMCKSSVPVQCKATGVPLPAPGPVIFGSTPAPAPHHSHSHTPINAPSPAPAAHAPPPRHSHSHTPINAPSPAPAALAPSPHHSHSPKASKAATAAAPSPDESALDIEPASPPKFALGPSTNPGIRPVFNPKSAASKSTASLPYSLVLMFVGIMAFEFF